MWGVTPPVGCVTSKCVQISEKSLHRRKIRPSLCNIIIALYNYILINNKDI